MSIGREMLADALGLPPGDYELRDLLKKVRILRAIETGGGAATIQGGNSGTHWCPACGNRTSNVPCSLCGVNQNEYEGPVATPKDGPITLMEGGPIIPFGSEEERRSRQAHINVGEWEDLLAAISKITPIKETK